MEQPGFEQPAPGQERADRGASHPGLTSRHSPNSSMMSMARPKGGNGWYSKRSGRSASSTPA